MNDGRKKKPQKFQNKRAFKILYDPQAIEHQKKVSQALLCKRCRDQIKWKLQYNKYKKITEPGKCNFCHEKVVVRSYMKSCDPCAQQYDICPKCLQHEKQLPGEVKLSAKQKEQKQKEEEKQMNDYLDTLRLRSKKKIARQLEKGIISWDSDIKSFVDQQGKQLVGLHFKNKGLEDMMEDEIDSDMDQDDI